jgi:hypothetical protein
VATGLARSVQPSFSLSVEGPQSAKAGLVALVEITVTNTSSHTVSVGLEDIHRGEFDFNFQVRDSEGKLAPGTKYMKAARGEEQGSGSTIVTMTESAQPELKPGNTLKVRADLPNFST